MRLANKINNTGELLLLFFSHSTFAAHTFHVVAYNVMSSFCLCILLVFSSTYRWSPSWEGNKHNKFLSCSSG